MVQLQMDFLASNHVRIAGLCIARTSLRYHSFLVLIFSLKISSLIFMCVSFRLGSVWRLQKASSGVQRHRAIIPSIISSISCLHHVVQSTTSSRSTRCAARGEVTAIRAVWTHDTRHGTFTHLQGSNQGRGRWERIGRRGRQ